MNFESVRAFVAVADEGQFRIAADQLGVTQQSVSKRIAALESSLGTTLFERVPTGAVLTSAGHRFLPSARAVLLAVKQAEESVRSEPRPLRVDVLNRSLASADLVRDYYRSARSRIEVVATNDMDTTTRGLLDGSLDAALRYLRRPVHELSPHLTQSFVYFEPLQIVVSNRHPLAERGSVRPADLRPFRAWVPGIVEGSEWAGFYDDLVDAFALDIDATGPDFGAEALFDTIAGSRSLFTFAGSRMRVAFPRQRELARIPVVDPTPLYPWSILWHSGNRHPGLYRLRSHLHPGRTPPAPGRTWLPTLLPG